MDNHGANEDGGRWYFSRKELEDDSPSRRDNIGFKKEAYLRKSYSTYLQTLGMRLKVPQLTIATAIIFCHRFFLRQSHAKNDRRTIATVCMFLAGKVEETPRTIKDVILVSYEILHEKDPEAAHKIKQKSTVSGVTQQATPKDSSGKEEHAVTNSHSQAGGMTSRPGTSKSMSHSDNPGGAQRTMVAQANEYDSGEMKNAFDQNADDEAKGNIDSQIDTVGHRENVREAQTMSKITSRGKEDEEWNATRGEIRKLKDKHFGQNFGNRERTLGQSPQDAIKKFDKDKVKAALEKRKKSQGAVTRKTDILDEDDLIERELEAGIEQATKSKKNRSDKRQNWSRHFERQEHEKHQEDAADGEHQGMKEHIEEVPDNINKSIPPLKSNNRKRKLWSSPDTTSEGRLQNDYAPGAHHYESHDHLEVRRRGSRLGDVEREHKRHVPENHM